MDVLELARWQFAITTVYHFFFVPITLGLSWLVAGMQTAWVRTGNEKWLRATKFFGKVFLINFAMGVVTGLVQEFQFGMNWSAYSRFVGDVFGAPLAVEGLVAFFLESTFLGLWIFGWDRLPKKLHLASIWLVSLGTMLSAYFILAANSWMQHPVGYTFNEERGRAELTDFARVLTQNTAVIAFIHTMSAAFMVAGALVAGISLYLLLKDKGADVARSTLRLGAITTLVASLAVLLSGDEDAKIMTEQQPMKMAAAEALYETAQPAPFSVLTIGTLDGSEPIFSIEIPKLLSFLATGSFDGKVEGINNLNEQYREQYAWTGLDNFAPNIPLTYWMFRLMIGVGMAAALWSAWALWWYRRGRRPTSRVGVPGGHRRPAAAPVRLQLRVDLHRGRPAALGGVRADDHRLRCLTDRVVGAGLDLDARLHRCCTRCWRWSRSGCWSPPSATGPRRPWPIRSWSGTSTPR